MTEQSTAAPTTDTPAVPAQETAKPTWDDLFKDQDPAKVKEALDNSRKWEQRAKENKTAADRLAVLEESQKTEAQKLADAAEQHRRDAEKARADLIRMQVALRYQIPESDLDLLGDGDEEQIEAKAKRLAELHAAATSDTPVRPRSDSDQGPRGAQTLPVTDEMERHLRSLLGG